MILLSCIAVIIFTKGTILGVLLYTLQCRALKKNTVFLHAERRNENNGIIQEILLLSS
jgi:hypothetical protein